MFLRFICLPPTRQDLTQGQWPRAVLLGSRHIAVTYMLGEHTQIKEKAVRWDKEVFTFPKGISLKVNVITWLEFKLACYDITVQNISHYATGTLLLPWLNYANIYFSINTFYQIGRELQQIVSKHWREKKKLFFSSSKPECLKKNLYLSFDRVQKLTGLSQVLTFFFFC